MNVQKQYDSQGGDKMSHLKIGRKLATFLRNADKIGVEKIGGMYYITDRFFLLEIPKFAYHNFVDKWNNYKSTVNINKENDSFGIIKSRITTPPEVEKILTSLHDSIPKYEKAELTNICLKQNDLYLRLVTTEDKKIFIDDTYSWLIQYACSEKIIAKDDESPVLFLSMDRIILVIAPYKIPEDAGVKLSTHLPSLLKIP